MTSAPSDTTRSILHVDMDAFFVSVELLDQPELRGRPVVVGGAGPRGVVAAASYEARSYGVRSAQPMSIARRRCPEAVILSGRHERYREVSREVMAIFDDVTPLVEPLSLDEAFLDVTGRVRSLGPAPEIARTVRSRVQHEVGLTCSVGVAHNKFLAKLASESAKPAPSPAGPIYGTGITVVETESVEEFLWPQPARALWGIGPATMEKLARLGVGTIGDIARLPLVSLESTLGAASGAHLHRLAMGLDDRPVVPDAVAKSISHEETFATDVIDRRMLDHELVRLADAVGERLRRSEQFARTVVLKVRFADFRTISRSRTPKDGVEDGPTIAAHARDLLHEVDLAEGVRLIGVGVSGLVEGERRAVQLTMLDERGQANIRPDVRPELHKAMDEIRGRYGRTSIGPASLAPQPDGGP